MVLYDSMCYLVSGFDLPAALVQAQKLSSASLHLCASGPGLQYSSGAPYDIQKLDDPLQPYFAYQLAVCAIMLAPLHICLRCIMAWPVFESFTCCMHRMSVMFTCAQSVTSAAAAFVPSPEYTFVWHSGCGWQC